MNKLDLDISKYSSDELCEIFNIDSNIKSDELISHLNTFRTTIITDNNMNLREKDGINKFIDNVADKISNALNINSFSSSHTNLISGSSLDHPIIENPNLQAGINAKIYEGKNSVTPEYPPGYINPINVKTTKHQINIDSRFRGSYYNSLSTNFHYSLPDTFRKVVNMRVTSFNIPLTIHSVNSLNNCFNVDSSNVVITSGNYSTPFTSLNYSQTPFSGGIVNEVNDSLINQSLSDISYSIDSITGKSVFTSTTGSYDINFNKDCSGNNDLNSPLPLKFGWNLGYRAGSYTLTPGNPLISEGTVCINSPRYLYLCINDYTAAGGNNFVALYNESTISPHIIARIQYQKLLQKNGVYNYGTEDPTFEATREYFGPVDIQKLNLQILDEYGRVVDFNNMDWSCSISFDVLYD